MPSPEASRHRRARAWLPTRRWVAAMADAGLFQLTVLRPSTIDPAANDRPSVPLCLAIDTKLHAGDRAPAPLGDRLLAFRAMREALPLGGPSRLHPLQLILDRGVDLIVHRAIARPTSRHFTTSAIP